MIFKHSNANSIIWIRMRAMRVNASRGPMMNCCSCPLEMAPYRRGMSNIGIEHQKYINEELQPKESEVNIISQSSDSKLWRRQLLKKFPVTIL